MLIWDKHKNDWRQDAFDDKFIDDFKNKYPHNDFQNFVKNKTGYSKSALPYHIKLVNNSASTVQNVDIGDGSGGVTTNQNYGTSGGSSGVIIRTINGGTTWDAPVTVTGSLPANPTLFSVFWVNTSIGFICMSGGAIITTTDGGVNWVTQSSGTGQILRSIFFINANTGWAVGNNGTIITTTNGGSTWAAQTSGTANTLMSVFFINANVGWAVGGSDTILTTTNGGSTWSAQTSGTTGIGFQGVFFINANIGWVVGSSGTIITTTNGGSTWTAQTSGTSNTINSVRFLNANTGWFCGNGGIISKTTNGGSTWTAQTSGVSSNLFNINIINNVVYACGQSGVILRNIDGGDVWASLTSGTSSNLQSVSMFDPGITIWESQNSNVTYSSPFTEYSRFISETVHRPFNVKALLISWTSSQGAYNVSVIRTDANGDQEIKVYHINIDVNQKQTDRAIIIFDVPFSFDGGTKIRFSEISGSQSLITKIYSSNQFIPKLEGEWVFYTKLLVANPYKEWYKKITPLNVPSNALLPPLT